MEAGSTMLYAYLSGEHPTLPLAELRAILEAEDQPYRVLHVFEQLALLEAAPEAAPLVARRAGMVKELGVVVAVAEADHGSILDAARAADWSPVRCPFYVKPRFIQGYGSTHLDAARLAAEVGGIVAGTTGCRVSASRPASMVRVMVTEGAAVLGVVLARQRYAEIHARRPRARPFFKPGALSPELSRVFVNLARARRGGVYLDPFCGTGGFAIEAALMGARVICGDLDRAMVRGAATNLSWLHLVDRCDVYHGDALQPPFRRGIVDSIGTDPPYGRSTTTARRPVLGVVEGFLHAAAEMLKRGGYVFFAMPHGVGDPEGLLATAGLVMVEKHFMRVHRSLTRLLVAAVRP